MSLLSGTNSVLKDPALAVMGLLPARYSDSIMKGRNPRSLSWRAAWISIALGLVVTTAFYWESAAQMARIWSTSASFNHGFLIFPICAYLIWLKRAALANMVPRPSPWGVVLIFGASLCWLMGHVASVAMVKQFAFVFVIQGVIISVLGLKIAKLLFFPLAYMLFAVPFGRFMIPPLQDVTAFFVVEGLRLFDIPVFLDGIFISIPTGHFKVAEACSGVRFLIATIALGTLFAYVTYQSRMRQFAFVALSVIVPVVANGIRAFGIVLTAYLTNNAVAVGVDHIVYGWVFFAIITVILLLIGMTFRDQRPADPLVDLDTVRNAAADAIDPKKVFAFAMIAAFVGMLSPVYAGYMAGRAIPEITTELPVPAASGGWRLAKSARSDWTAVYPKAHAVLQQRYVKGTNWVDLYIAYYGSQRQGAELVSNANAVSDAETWSRAASTNKKVRVSGKSRSVYRVRLRRNLSGKRIAYQWYWIGGHTTSSPFVAKFLQVVTQLLTGDEAAASIVVSTSYDDLPSEADRVLKDFLGGLQPLSPMLHGMSGK